MGVTYAGNLPAILGRIPLFSSMPPEVLAELGACLRARQFHAGEGIVHMDEPGDSFFYILQGRVKVVHRFATGRESVICLLGPTEFFGEQSLLDGGPRSASIITIEPTTCLVLSRPDFLRFVHNHAEVAINIIITLSERLRRVNMQLQEAYHMSLTERLAKRLLALSEEYGLHTPGGLELKLAITLEDLALMVGATKAQIQRIIQEWQFRGIIRVSWSEEIIILLPEDLARIK